jgi:hypothetical protein
MEQHAVGLVDFYGRSSPSCCIGSVAGSKVALAFWGSDREDMLDLSLDHSLYENTSTSAIGWSGWTTTLGTPTNIRLMGAPAAVSRQASAIDAFMRGTNGDIYTNEWTGSAWGAGGIAGTLLERRPDVASSERRLAAANEQIGIARSAYFPAVTLGASAGLEGTSIKNWFT